MARNKYGAVKTTVGSITFHSKAEAHRYMELKLLQKAGEIEGLKLQPKFPLIINGVSVGTYIADFMYYDVKKEDEVVEDKKGYKTDVYRLKKKLVKALYGITIYET